MFIIKEIDYSQYKKSFHEAPKRNTKWSPLACTAPQLRGHIVNLHFSPDVLAWYGVARYDIEVAAYRSFDLDWVVKKAYEFLEEPIGTTMRKMIMVAMNYEKLSKTKLSTVYKNQGLDYYDIQSYKQMLVKNLLYIEQLGCSEVDWQRVLEAAPNARLELDISKDSADGPFDPTYYTNLLSKTDLTS